MALMSSGLKKKLTISVCDEDKVDEGSVPPFEVMLNPESFKHEYTISYSQKKALGQTGSELKFHAVEPDKMDFTIVLDGTGVVEGATTEVKDQVKQLQAVVYNYSGSEHEPQHIKLLWGSLLFYGRLSSMSADYTLFKPSGEALRAKITLAFIGFMDNKEMALKANKTSPDLTHYVEVKAGDTLPLLCQRIYKESAYYPAVAHINNIRHFRDLKPGLKLYFPPLA